jgi:hypothetical protein
VLGKRSWQSPSKCARVREVYKSNPSKRELISMFVLQKKGYAWHARRQCGDDEQHGGPLRSNVCQPSCKLETLGNRGSRGLVDDSENVNPQNGSVSCLDCCWDRQG